MKNKYILLAGMLLAGSAFVACDDDKQLTLDAPEVKLLETITFDVSEELPLPVGMDSTITYTYGPEDADDPTILFTSSDESVATVDQNGTMRDLKVGEAVITAQTPLGFQVYEAQASVRVNVIPELIKVTKIDITNTTPAGEDGLIYVTDELQLAATVSPDDATYTRVVWSSADESIATVDQNGKVLCIKEGEATIYATSTDRGGTRGEYKFTINKYIAATGISIKPLDGPVCISYGAFNLQVTYEPTGATVGSVDWMSDNEEVASVHRGTVTPHGFGTCNIIATCIENGESTSVQVTVEPGFYVWDAETGFPNCLSNNEKPEIVDGKWHLPIAPPNPGGKWRRDFKVDCSANNPLVMYPKEYPVFAVRMTKINGGNATGDFVDVALGNASNPNPKNGIDLGDGTQLLIYNLGTRPNYVNATVLNFRVFQVKIADIPYDNFPLDRPWYDIYWMRTFKSEAEAQAFANEQVLRGE